MDISAAMVKALRDKTGLSMMDCKNALVEAGGDEDKAQDILRKKGLHKVAQRAGNEASKGRVFVEIQGGIGAIAELRCESEPVTGTEDFVKLGTLAVRAAAAQASPSVDAVLDASVDGVQIRRFHEDVLNRIREKITLHRVGKAAGVLGSYVHHNGQVGVLVEFSGDCPDALKADVCMHIAAMKPVCARREEVAPALIEKERAFAREEVKNKPPQMIDKIVEGKINRWFGEIVLLEQPFVKDDKQTVGQVLKAASPTLTVNRFLRFEVGGA